MVREAGLEPARPEWTLEPESSESANSTTRASLERLHIIAPESRLVKSFFKIFLHLNLPLYFSGCDGILSSDNR